MKSILDPSFKYVSANNTDIAKTFARVRKSMAEEAARKEAAQQKQPVVQLKRESK